MKNIILLILIIVFSSGPLQAKPKPKPILKLGYITYPPLFIKKNNTEATGILVEHFENNLGKKYKLRWIEIPIFRAVSSLNKSQIDVYITYVYSKERENLVSFLPKRYFYTRPALCTRYYKSSLKNGEVSKILVGKTLLLPRGTMASRLFNDIENLNIFSISYSGDYIKRAFKMLESRRVDYALLATTVKLDKTIKKYKSHCINFGKEINFHLSVKKESRLYKALKKINIPVYNPRLTPDSKSKK